MGCLVRRAEVAASLLSCDMGRLGDEAARLEQAGADRIHLDVMDGVFVPELTFGAGVARAVRARVTIPVEAHLMVSAPGTLAEGFVDAGCALVTIHAEAAPHLDRLLQRIRELGARAGAALNPATPACCIRWCVDCLDDVLVMTVNPGYGGQKHLDYVRPKIAEVRSILDRAGSTASVSVDGGGTADNARALRELGAGILIAGSFISRAGDPAAAIQSLR